MCCVTGSAGNAHVWLQRPTVRPQETLRPENDGAVYNIRAVLRADWPRRGILETTEWRHFSLSTRGLIYKISYNLSYDYLKFIVRSTYDSDLQRAKIYLGNIVSQFTEHFCPTIL